MWPFRSNDSDEYCSEQFQLEEDSFVLEGTPPAILVFLKTDVQFFKRRPRREIKRRVREPPYI